MGTSLCQINDMCYELQRWMICLENEDINLVNGLKTSMKMMSNSKNWFEVQLEILISEIRLFNFSLICLIKLLIFIQK